MRISVMIFAAAALLTNGALAADTAAQNSRGAAALVRPDGYQQNGSPGEGVLAGIASESYVAHAFNPVDSGVTYAFSTAGGNLSVYRTNATGSVWMEAPINIPGGAEILAIEFRFCDTSATKAFYSFLTINAKSGSVNQPELVTSTGPETPGCVNRTFVFGPPLVVDNDNNAYSLEANIGGTGTAGDNTVQLSQARVYFFSALIFADGFETANTSRWSTTIP